MNRQQIDQFLLSFKNNLQYKIIKVFVIITMTFFAILTLFKLVIIQKSISIRNQSEFTYLQRVGRKMMISEEARLNCVLLFLDSSCKLAQANTFTNSTLNNQNGTFFNKNNSRQNASQQNTKELPLVLQQNVDILKLNDEVSCVFTFKNNKTKDYKVYFNSVQLGIESNKKLNQSIIDNFISQNTNYYQNSSKKNYYIFYEAVNQFNDLYIFTCSQLNIAKQTQILCVLLIRKISDSISRTKNNQYFRQSTFDSILTGVTRMPITQWINNSEVQLQTSFVMDCIKSRIDNKALGSYLDIFEGQAQICRHRHYFFFDIFGPFFTYADFKLQVSPSNASNMYNSGFGSQQLTIEYFISANSSYRNDINRIISSNINQLRYMGYSLILILGFSLLLIKYPDDLVENDIINSILQIHKLYEHLRNKDQKEFTNIYNKRKTNVFSFIPDYLNKYMWVYKLIKANKEKTKYKKILKEGIELFGDEEYSVKRFIYKELIRLEKKLIDSLLKVRKLPIKKKATSKLEFQLLQTKIIQNHDKSNTNKRRNANMRLLNPDDDQFMKNISVSFKPNRGVRFSNDIQTVEIDQGPVLRKSKMADSQARSCETIKNDLSEPDFESVKHNENNKDSVKSLKDEEESYTSLNQLSRSRKKDSSLRSRGLESIYADIQNMKLDEQQSEMKEIAQEENEEEKELFAMSRQRDTFTEEISNIYHKTMEYYEDLIKLKTNQAKKQREDQLLISVNTIYKLTLQKYQLLAKMLRFQNEMGLAIDQELRDEISKFKDISYLEQNYMALINYELLQEGEVVKMQIYQVLCLPVSFKNLQFLARSSQSSVRIMSRRMLAQMSEKLSPHLDSILMKNICSLLQQEETTCNEKRNLLMLLTRTLQRYYANFTEQISDLSLAIQFYNKKNKKIYFIVSILNPKPFSKLIDRLYEYIQPFDMLVIFNLDEQSFQPEPEVSEPFISKLKAKKNCIQRVKFELNEQDFCELFSYVPDRLKEVQEKNGSSSSKTIARKKMYEKEFHEILNCIEADQTEFSKYLFVLLGEEHYTYTGETQDTSSSGNHRPQQQKIHQEITKIIDKGYYHIMLAGHQLSQYPSKYGKLKKYLKLSPQLLQIELSDKDQEQSYKALQKYLK